MIEPEFTLFKVQVEVLPIDSSKFNQSHFSIAPEGLNSVDMRFASDKLILPMMDSEMFVVTDIYQTVISSPSIGMDDAVNIHSTPYNAL